MNQEALFYEPPDKPCESCGCRPSSFPQDCVYERGLAAWLEGGLEHQEPEQPKRPRECIAFDPERSPIPF